MKNTESDKMVRFRTIDEFNKVLGQETLHPLVSSFDMANGKYVPVRGPISYDFFTIFLKDVNCGNIVYGRNMYDYQEGTLVFIAPDQTVQFQMTDMSKPLPKPKGWCLLFHPDFIKGTQLGRNISRYSFFSYRVNEALHLSEKERETVVECFKNIRSELEHPVDRQSKNLIISNLELFLNYCTRFYERQFLTRLQANTDILDKFEEALDEYFRSNLPKTSGLPTVKFLAEKLHFSPNYLSDMLRKDTGKSAIDHIQLRLVEAAKEKLFGTDKTVSEIAYELGFDYPQYFSRLFKKRTGLTPNEFRARGN